MSNHRPTSAQVLTVALTTLAACTATDAAQMAIEVLTENRQIAVYELLPMTVRFSNIGDKPMELFVPMFKESGIGEILVTKPDKSEVVISRPDFSGVSVFYARPPIILLKPGEQLEVELEVSGDWCAEKSHNVFDLSGEYEVTVRYSYNGLQAESEPVMLSVSNAPERELAALRLVKKIKHQSVLYVPDLIGLYPESVGDLQAVSKSLDSQLYANYARASLARWSMHLAKQAGSTDPNRRETELDAAESYLDAITDESELTISARIELLREELAILRKRLNREERSESSAGSQGTVDGE